MINMKQTIDVEKRNVDLTLAFDEFEKSVTAWRYKEGLLIENPEILLDKLKK